MERTRRDSVCSVSSYGCESTLTRFVWAGDQLLWELRVPGGNEVVGSGLESTSASGDMYGRVSYFHAGGIDKPLLITKEGVESVVPRETWRGQFHAGTSPANGAVRDCTQGGQTGCLLIAWPGWKTSASHAWGSDAPDIDVWYGGLVDGMRDASGQMYMRNRYYDPGTGQFTQTDPIGLAGGLNAYGFAAGDPVSYSDPYGLCSTKIDKSTGESVDGGTVCKLDPIVVEATPNSTPHDRCEVAGFLSKYISILESNPTTFVDGTYPTDLDTKYYNRGDLFQVGDQWLRADEFGNYAAGYAGQHAYVEAGYAAMILGGIAYASFGREEHWSDRESRPMINAGANRARLEQTFDGRTRGMRGIGIVDTPYVEPLTSRADCN